MRPRKSPFRRAPRTSLAELHVALILLRYRTGKTQGEVAREADIAKSSLGAHERSRMTQGTLDTLESLLTYYEADFHLCHRLILQARSHLGDLRKIRGPKMVHRATAQAIWTEIDRQPDTSWIQSQPPPPA